MAYDPPTTTKDSLGLDRRSIQERIDWVVHRAHCQSVDFKCAGSWLERSSYMAQHPTAIAAFMCMDGRVNVPLVTNTPRGIIEPFRNLGGQFDLGWPHFGEVVAETVKEVTNQGHKLLAIITYHYSKGDSHRGCAGFTYDTAAARVHASQTVAQMESFFGRGRGIVYPLLCGLETDEDAIVFHGHDGQILDLSTVQSPDEDQLSAQLGNLYPDMPHQMLRDLVPLAKRNVAHIAEIRGVNRGKDIEHCEWMICVGRGFDWLQMSNLALIIGPYSPDLADPIMKAAAIIEGNMKAGRVPDDGFLVLSDAPYREIGLDRTRAELESTFLSKFAADVIKTKFPNLAKKMHVRAAVIDSHSREVEILKL